MNVRGYVPLLINRMTSHTPARVVGHEIRYAEVVRASKEYVTFYLLKCLWSDCDALRDGYLLQVKRNAKYPKAYLLDDHEVTNIYGCGLTGKETSELYKKLMEGGKKCIIR